MCEAFFRHLMILGCPFLFVWGTKKLCVQEWGLLLVGFIVGLAQGQLSFSLSVCRALQDCWVFSKNGDGRYMPEQKKNRKMRASYLCRLTVIAPRFSVCALSLPCAWCPKCRTFPAPFLPETRLVECSSHLDWSRGEDRLLCYLVPQQTETLGLFRAHELIVISIPPLLLQSTPHVPLSHFPLL